MGYRFTRSLVAALAICLAVAGLVPGHAAAETQTAVVMTRNVYLGADLTPIIGAPGPAELFTAAADVFSDVVRTDFEARAKLLAQELVDTEPDLVGLQEIALWQTGPIFDPAEAQDVAFDFLAILEAEIVSLGLGYTTAVVQETFEFELPATVTSDDIPVPVLRDVRLTMRNVILVRDGVEYSNAQQGYFDVNTVYPTIVGDVVDLRGWVAVDATMGKRPFRFVNTHLEPYVTPVRNIQAQEMIDGPFATNLKLVAVGDFNTPPEGAAAEAYELLTDPSNGKMTDVWPTVTDDPGYTCCQAELLDNPVSTADQRIDLILTRTRAVKAVSAQVVGEEARTPTGLWASDHFGVVAELAIP